MIKFVFSFLALLSLSFSFAQGGVKIVHVSDLNTDISGTEVEAVGDPSDTRIYYDMRVINLTGSTIDIRYQRQRLADSNRDDEICDENLCYSAADAQWYQTPAVISVDHEDTTLLKPQIDPNAEESCGIHVYYVVENGTVLDSVTITFRTTNSSCFLSLEEEEANNNDFNMYPNPSKNNLKIEKLRASDEAILVFDALGKQVLTSKINSTSKDLKLNTLNSGIYFVRILNENGTMSEPKKLVVRK